MALPAAGQVFCFVGSPADVVEAIRMLGLTPPQPGGATTDASGGPIEVLALRRRAPEEFDISGGDEAGSDLEHKSLGELAFVPVFPFPADVQEGLDIEDEKKQFVKLTPEFETLNVATSTQEGPDIEDEKKKFVKLTPEFEPLNVATSTQEGPDIEDEVEEKKFAELKAEFEHLNSDSSSQEGPDIEDDDEKRYLVELAAEFEPITHEPYGVEGLDIEDVEKKKKLTSELTAMLLPLMVGPDTVEGPGVVGETRKKGFATVLAAEFEPFLTSIEDEVEKKLQLASLLGALREALMSAPSAFSLGQFACFCNHDY